MLVTWGLAVAQSVPGSAVAGSAGGSRLEGIDNTKFIVEVVHRKKKKFCKLEEVAEKLFLTLLQPIISVFKNIEKFKCKFFSPKTTWQ